MILVENNIVYRIPKELMDDILSHDAMKLPLAHNEKKMTAHSDTLQDECLDETEYNARMIVASHFGGALEMSSLSVVIDVWKIIKQQYDICRFVIDMEVSSISMNIHDESYTAYNLDTDEHMMCEGCRTKVMEYLQWADTRKRIHGGEGTSEDIVSLIANNPLDNDSNITILTMGDDGEFIEISTEEFITEIAKDDDFDNGLPKPTHQGSNRLN